MTYVAPLDFVGDPVGGRLLAGLAVSVTHASTAPVRLPRQRSEAPHDPLAVPAV